jgi:protein RecA
MEERERSIELARGQIEKQYGKGAIMKMGEKSSMDIEVIPTGALALDIALGIGGLPRGRIVEIFGPEASGKCHTADTYVWTDQGLETVAELFERCGQPASCTSRVTSIAELGVRAVNERGELEQIEALTHNNRKPVVRVRLASGREVTATHNHPLRVINDAGYIVWRNARQIQHGDVVVSALFGADEAASGDGLSEDEAVLLGYLVAEGSLGYTTSVRFTNTDPKVGAEFTKLAEALWDGFPLKVYNDREFVVHSKALRTELAARYGLDYVTAAGKSIPHCVRTAGRKMQRAFLSALFEGDGWIDESSTVGICSASERLAREVQLLLYGFGIPCTLSSKFIEGYPDEYWTVTVNPAAAHRFVEEIGFRSERRSAQVAAHFHRSNQDPRFENIPHLTGIIQALRDDIGGDREFDRIAGDLFRSDINLECSRTRLQRLVAWGDDRADRLTARGVALLGYLRSLAEARYTYETVVSVDDAGLQPTFDLALPRTHSFLANNVLSHNTTLAMHVVAEAQRNGGICAYIDAEHSVDPTYAEAIGVNVDELLISQPDTGEQALEIADILIRSNALDVIVIDSVAALTPRAEIEGEMGDSHMGLQARLMSQALRKLTANLNHSNTICIFINQLREKIGVLFGSPETTPGGRALKFYSSARLDIRRIEAIKDGVEVVGNRTRVKVVKLKVAAPFKQAEFDIMYGKGISREGSVIDVGVDQGVVKKSGAWYTYEGEQLGQGKENAKQFLIENPELMVTIYERICQQAGIGGVANDVQQLGEAADAAVSNGDVPLGADPKDDEPILLDD